MKRAFLKMPFCTVLRFRYRNSRPHYLIAMESIQVQEPLNPPIGKDMPIGKTSLFYKGATKRTSEIQELLLVGVGI